MSNSSAYKIIQVVLLTLCVFIPVGMYLIYQKEQQTNYAINLATSKTITTLLNETRKTYSNNVVKKVKENSQMIAGRDHHNNERMIPNPATFSIELAESVSGENLTVRMYSNHPFLGREDSATPKDIIEENALDILSRKSEEEFIYSNGDRFFYAVPIIMNSQECVDCHNRRSDSQKKDWRVGDVRAVLAANIKRHELKVNLLYPIFLSISIIALLTIVILLNRILRLENATKDSMTDSLTGTFNRRYINKNINDFFNTHYESNNKTQGVAVMMLDVDHFKNINDTFSHEVGDQCLCDLSVVIRNALRREKDIVARYGGEEFLIYLSNSGLDNAVAIANKIRINISEQPMTSENIIVTASIGICYVGATEDKPNFKSACTIADEALYQAKENGRNNVVAFQYSL